MADQKAQWCVYIVRCKDNSLYTGISSALMRRLEQHNSGKGAKYTRYRSPVNLVYFYSGRTRSEVAQWEARIKSLPKKQKEQMVCLFASGANVSYFFTD
jgi:putative endonuclease